jgi:hypothetical protein
MFHLLDTKIISGAHYHITNAVENMYLTTQRNIKTEDQVTRGENTNKGPKFRPCPRTQKGKSSVP